MMAAGRRGVRLASQLLHRLDRDHDLRRRRDDAFWIDRRLPPRRNVIQRQENRSTVEVEPLESGICHPTLMLKERNREVCWRDDRRVALDGDIVRRANDLAQPAGRFREMRSRVFGAEDSGSQFAARFGPRRRSWHLGAEDAKRLDARLLERETSVSERLSRDARLLAEQPEQQMLRADVGMTELARLTHRQLEHLLGSRR